jgi:phthiocerol/phenolphthiocerol synthesis type-I polyketide synthase C
MTVPSIEAQKKVITDALSLSRLQAADIDYIEAHGTGTPVGDPM